MAKVKKNTLKAIQNRNRVKFHRKWKLIVSNELRSLVNISSNVQSGHENKKATNEQKEINDELSGQEKLRRWALKYNIAKHAISDLLKILISLGIFWLPKDSRTLLSTPRYIEMVKLTNGQFWYNGIEKNLRMIYANLSSDLTVDLCFNVDGLPLFNSSKNQFWPILASIFGKFIFKFKRVQHFIYIIYILDFPQIRPFVIAIWCGEGKAVLNEYLAQFVAELKSLLTTGIVINNNMLHIKIKAFICDTPARAYIKGIFIFSN